MNRRNLLLAVLLVSAVLISMVWPRLPMAGDPDPLARIPREGIGLKSRDIEISPTEKKWLGGAAGLKRVFSFRGRLWLLAVTDGTNNRQAVHDPTYCFIGEGWKITGQSQMPLAGGSAMCVTMERNGETSRSLYWFYDGNTPFSSVVEFWLKSTLRRITRGLSGPEPLLFILRPVGNAGNDWQASANEIAPLLLPKSK